MNGGFAKGLIIGGVIGASLSIMMGSGMLKGRARRRMMKVGRNLLRKSGGVIGDLIEVFR